MTAFLAGGRQRWTLGLLLSGVLAPPAVALAVAGRPILLVGSAAIGGILGWCLGRPLLRRLAGISAEAKHWQEEALRAQQVDRFTEQALHHCADVLRSIVSALPVGVVAISRDARVELWNHAAESILGYSAEEMIGQPAPTQVFTSASGGAEGGAADMFLRMVTGQLVKSEEVTCRRKDGSAVAASFSGAPLMSNDERIEGAICVFEDLSHRNTLARALHQAQKMEAVGQLTGGMAHDFNNILGVAIGNLDLLEEELALQPAAAEKVTAALNALLRGAELTRALLAFARRQPLRPTVVDVGELLGGTMKVLSRVLGEQVQTGLQSESGLWPVVVDAAQLEAAVTNLAINARDAMPHGGWLKIVARNTLLDADDKTQFPDAAPGEYVSIEVNDTGTGMTGEVLGHVFEPFFTTKPVGQGTGLGLSMVYGFTRQSGGQIKIYSEPGIGTTVRLYLPRARADARRQQLPGAADTPLRGGDETVLVVDDNPDVRRVVAGQLSQLGYRVLHAENGPEALGVIGTEPGVDLLFTDVVMPHGMDGFALAEEARKMRPDLKLLFTSGFPSSSVQAQRQIDPGLEFLGKPYRRQELARAVRKVLDGKE